MLVDCIFGHSMFSFMDDFNGYNQIRMDPLDVVKTPFMTPMGTFFTIQSCHLGL